MATSAAIDMEPVFDEKRIEVAPGVRLVLRVFDGRRGAEGDPTSADRLPPFLLVHGLASNARTWDGMAARLAGLGHLVVEVDQRGHGRSDKPDAGYDFETVTSDLCAVITAEGLDRPVVVGQSWGGNVVLELAWRFPNLVRGIACVDGGTIELRDQFDRWEDCAERLAPPRLTGLPLAAIEDHLRSAHPDWPETGIAGTLANFEVRPDGTVAPWLTFERHMMILRALWEHRPSERYASLRVPVLLVPAADGNDDWTAAKRAAVARAEQELPRARVHWFAPADHDIQAQHPDELADVLHGATVDGYFR